MPVLEYTDDTVIFLEAKEDMVENLKALLIWFKAAFGLHVNVHKNKVYRLNIGDIWDSIMDTWGCCELTLPDIYLGHPLA